MATYVAVVSFMQDLEQLLSSYHPILGSRICPFTKEETEILYNHVSLMDSFLLGGENYNHRLMNQTLEKRIRDVALIAGNYVDFWVINIMYFMLSYSSSFFTLSDDSLPFLGTDSVFCNPFVNPSRLPSWDAFPLKLVKLTLSGTSLPWEDMLKLKYATQTQKLCFCRSSMEICGRWFLLSEVLANRQHKS